MKINLWTSIRDSALKTGYNNFTCLLNNKDFLALEKSPYFPLETNIKSNFSFDNITDHLCEQYGTRLKRISKSGLGNCMSGVVLFAKSQEAYEYINKLYLKNKITEKYLVILVREPEKSFGKIMVPIRYQVEKSGIFMKCATEYSAVYENPSFVPNDILPAISDFKIISTMPTSPKTDSNTYKNYHTRSRACLVEVSTNTCFQDQIRVHMSEILGCNILGDNKYGLSKEGHQILPKFMLRLLKLKNEWDVKLIPTFIHLSEISFCSPRDDSKQILIRCPLSEYFSTCLELLKIK